MNPNEGFPAWHDANGWMEVVRKMKATFGADNITVEIDMPHGILTYATPEDDDE